MKQTKKFLTLLLAFCMLFSMAGMCVSVRANAVDFDDLKDAAGLDTPTVPKDPINPDDIIESVNFNSIIIAENTTGYVKNSGGHTYFHYEWWNKLSGTIMFQDGTTAQIRDGEGFEYNGESFSAEFDNIQSYENPLLAGNTYTATVTIGSKDYVVTVSIIENDGNLVDCGACGENLIWTLDNEGTLIISGTGAMYDWAADENPWYANADIVSVVIESGATTIGETAFYECSGLQNVVVPDSVTAIGEYAFSRCTGLQGIAIPESVTEIQDGAFAESGLQSIVIPDSVAIIRENTFAGCSDLQNVEISNGVAVISDGAFSGCGSLQNITIPNGVTYIGIDAFWECTGLQSVTIPASVTTIDKYAFSDCPNLTDVYYGGSEEQWNAIKIYDCDSLLNATIHFTEHVHSFTNYVSDNNATCIEQGTETAKCDGCDATDTRTENIPVKGHTAGEPVEEEGFMVTYCSVCGEEMSREEIVPEQPEEPEEPAKDPVATFGGLEFTDLSDALKYAAKNGGGIVKLIADTVEYDLINVKNNVKLDLNGCTLTALDGIMAMFDTSEIIDSARVSAKDGGQLLVADDELFLYETNEMMPVRRAEGTYEFAQLAMRTNFNSNFSIGAGEATFQAHYRGHADTKVTNKAYFQDLFKNNNASDLGLKIQLVIEGTKVDGLPGRFIFLADESQIKTLATGWRGAMTVTASGLGALTEYDIYLEIVFVGVNGTTVATHDYVFSYNPG